MALHDGDGVVEHTAGESPTGLADEDRSSWVFTGEDGEGTEVVEMAVREDDEVEGVVIDEGEVGQGLVSCELWVQARIDGKAEGTRFHQ